MYRYGQGVPKDYEEAAKWYRKSAKQGNFRAHSDLNFMYRVGQIKPDIATTAEQGNVEDQHSLGVRYKNGIGVPQDSAEALKWFRMAAEQGNPDAQFTIASMYYQGTGVEMDSAEAVKWYERAAEQGHEPAKSILGSMKRAGMYASSDAQTSAASEQHESTGTPSIKILMEKVDRLEKSEQFWKENAKSWEGITASVHALADKIANELLELRAENYVLKRKLDECGAQAPSEGSHEEQHPRARM
jgi:TPR repeat protein